MSEKLEMAMADEETRTISVTGIEITDTLFRYAIEPFLRMDQDGEPIAIYLNTPGGCPFTGLAFADVLERAQSPVTLYLLGVVASAGMLIPMGAFKNDNVDVVAYPSTIGMMHHGSLFLDEMEFERAEDWFRFVSDHKRQYMNDFILSHSLYTEEDMAQLERADRWMNANELVSYGFADRIL